MKEGFRQAMGWLHTWAGLAVGWVLFFIFLTGTTGYFDAEIDRWMQPERPLQQAAAPAQAAVARGVAHLSTVAPRAERWFIRPPAHRSPKLHVSWRLRPDDGTAARLSDSADLDPATGLPIAYRDTGGGQLLYGMHWRLHYLPLRAAEWIVGICSMIMFVAMITGVIIHKRIFRDVFTLRLRKGQRSWLDAHNMLSVLSLPFYLMITWSGLVFVAYTYMAPVIWASYGRGDVARDNFFAELFERDEIPKPSGLSSPLTPLSPLLARAANSTGAGTVRFVIVHHPGDSNARVIVAIGDYNPSMQWTEQTYDGTTGRLLAESGPKSAPLMIRQTLLGLHEGLFAGPLLRWFYFLSGVMGTAMIGAGLLLWTVKRRTRIGEAFGFRLVERLNIGTIVGLPVAVAGYFWANRLIPVGIEARAAWEAHAMFIAWAVLLAHAFLRPPARAWAEQLWLAAAAFGLLPLLNLLTTDRHLGITLPAGVWELAGFDLIVLALGLSFAGAAWVLGHRGQQRAMPARLIHEAGE